MVLPYYFDDFLRQANFSSSLYAILDMASYYACRESWIDIIMQIDALLILRKIFRVINFSDVVIVGSYAR